MSNSLLENILTSSPRLRAPESSLYTELLEGLETSTARCGEDCEETYLPPGSPHPASENEMEDAQGAENEADADSDSSAKTSQVPSSPTDVADSEDSAAHSSAALEPLCESLSESSCRSLGASSSSDGSFQDSLGSSSEWPIAECGSTKPKLSSPESWWVPLSEDAARLAEDLLRAGWLPPAFYSKCVGSSDVRSRVRTIRRFFKRYRYFILFVAAVTLVNGLFSLLLIECLLGPASFCVLGPCHSPHFNPGKHVAYDRTTMNTTITPASPAKLHPTFKPSRAYTDADDEAFINELSKEWAVSPHPHVPRVYTLTKQHGLYRAFLVQDACYLYTQGTGPEHGRQTGVWFDGDSLDAVRQVDPRGLLDAREFEKLDPLQLLTGPDQDAAQQDAVHSGAFGFVPDPAKLQKRMNRTTGTLVGPKGLADYLEYSSTTGLRVLKASTRTPHGFVGIVGGFESHGHTFSSHAVFLSEVASPPSEFWSAATVFFPGDRKLWSTWTVGAIKVALGPEAKALPGQQQGLPVCFHNVLFTMIERNPSTVELDNFRHRSWAAAEAVLGFVKQNSRVLPSVSLSPELEKVERVVASAAEDVRAQLGLSPDLIRSTRLLSSLSGAKAQVTVLVDRVEKQKVVCSKIANIDALLRVVRKAFPRVPVQPLVFQDLSFVEQVAAFKRTVLLITPQGVASGSVVLLPRGASVVEIFPYMFRSDALVVPARIAGLNYVKWENEDLASSSYDDDCMVKGNYLSLSASECRRHRPCLLCVRDHVSTTVEKQQFRSLLTRVQAEVKKALTVVV